MEGLLLAKHECERGRKDAQFGGTAAILWEDKCHSPISIEATQLKVGRAQSSGKHLEDRHQIL